MSLRAAFDLHVHSAASHDACDWPEALIAAARRQGLDGIAITDHDNRKGFEYCLKRGLAREDGLPVEGILIIPGEEITTADGHLLAYGPSPRGLAGKPALEACKQVTEAGGVPVPAHPFDAWRQGIRPPRLNVLPISSLEIFNSASSRKTNQQAAKYASVRSLGRLGGSDAHLASAVGAARTLLEVEELSVANVLAALRRGGEVKGRRLGLIALLRKQSAILCRRKIE